MSTDHLVKITSNRRVTIPLALLEELGLNAGDKLSIEIFREQLILRHLE